MDERLASLPDPLVALDGRKIVAASQWQHRRRPELVDLFREHIYGREPLQRPDSLSFTVVTESSILESTATRKQVDITFEGPGGTGVLHLLLFVPNNAPKPTPVFLLIDNRGTEDVPDRIASSAFWPAEYMLSKGYAAAIFQVEDLDPDYDDDFRNGVHGIFDRPDQPRPENAWATISAWAWGASRVMDYFETDPDIDAKRVALVGHSRGGKAALWAGAVDERFAMVVSNNSGSTGAALSRGKIGEKIKNININFPHWFTGNYKKYNDKEDELPVDQHMLLSLIAPRPLYVTSASEDSWADPESEFLSLLLAQPVFRLFGLQGLETQPFPQPDSPIHREKIGYHLRTGKHDLTEYDWQCFLDFARKYM